MRVINEIILIAIAIVALVSLVTEMEERRNLKHELALKFCFGSLAIAAFSATVYDTLTWYSFMNTCVLVFMLIRLSQFKK